MKELFDKLTTYNFFNNLFPGILFSLIVTQMTRIQIIQKDILFGLFLYYFIGMIISRFGSLVIEPILKKISFIKMADYNDFLKVSEKDMKIETLLEVNNLYRSIISMIILFYFFLLYDYLILKWTFLQKHGTFIIVFLILILFLFSLKKQTNFITKRIKSKKHE